MVIDTDKLDAMAAAGTLHGLTVWKHNGEYQANLQTGKSAGWRVRRAATPSDAINLVLGMDYVDEVDDRNGIVSEPVDFTEAAVAQLEAEEPVDEPDAGIFD